MDIIEFIEKTMGMKLLDWEKDFVMNLYDAVKTGKTPFDMPARHCSRERMKDIACLVRLFYLIDKDFISHTALINTINSMYEPGCMERRYYNNQIERGIKLCKDCAATFESNCVCSAVVKTQFKKEVK